MKTISKIRRVSLREVWKHEARDFTQWLQGNLDVLSEIVDIPLASAEKEQPAGTFSSSKLHHLVLLKVNHFISAPHPPTRRNIELLESYII